MLRFREKSQKSWWADMTHCWTVYQYLPCRCSTGPPWKPAYSAPEASSNSEASTEMCVARAKLLKYSNQLPQHLNRHAGSFYGCTEIHPFLQSSCKVKSNSIVWISLLVNQQTLIGLNLPHPFNNDNFNGYTFKVWSVLHLTTLWNRRNTQVSWL